MSGSVRPVVAGVLAVAAGVATGELVAELVGRPQAGTVVDVGGVLVDAAPTPVKEFAVATLGTADKPVLLAGIAVALVVLAGLLGVLGSRARRAGRVGAAVLGRITVVRSTGAADEVCARLSQRHEYGADHHGSRQRRQRVDRHRGQRMTPFPDGATGRHTITVTAS